MSSYTNTVCLTIVMLTCRVPSSVPSEFGTASNVALNWATTMVSSVAADL